MALMVDNSKTYLRQMDKNEVEKDLWPKLKSGQLTSSIWRKGQTQPYQLVSVAVTGEATLKVAAEDFYNKILLSEFPGISVFMKFKATEEIQFFASGQFKADGDGKHGIVTLSAPYFVSTKRSTCRYLTTDMDRISLNLAGHTFNCFDISSGGFSTEVKREECGGLTKGSSFEQVNLKYQLKNFIIPTVQLINIIDVIGQPDRVRLAFKFEGMRPQDEDALWVEVNKSIKKIVDLMGQ